jgi:hypothetical protein
MPDAKQYSLLERAKWRYTFAINWGGQMIGLIAIIVVGGLLLLACWVFVWTYRAKRRKGKSEKVAFGWAIGAVVLLSLPITWDAIPTWIAFEYYAKKEAEFTVFKTLEQWKAENPGVAETLEPYGRRARDERSNSISMGSGKSRTPLNARFASDTQSEHLFLSVGLTRHEIVDTRTGEVVFRFVAVASGNSGGLASGGSGWAKPWLVHRSAQVADVDRSYRIRNEFAYLGSK